MASSLSPGCSRGTAKANCDCEGASRCPPRHVGLGPRGELSRRVLIDPPIAGRAGAGGWLFRLWLLPLSWLWPPMSCDFCADICAYYVLTNCLLCAYYVNHVRELGLGHLDMCILLLKLRSVLELAVSILLHSPVHFLNLIRISETVRSMFSFLSWHLAVKMFSYVLPFFWFFAFVKINFFL